MKTLIKELSAITTLTANTRVNSVLFIRKNSPAEVTMDTYTDNIIFANDMNMTFDEFNFRALGKTEPMYDLVYTLKGTIEKGKNIFKLYFCETDNYLAQIVKIVKIN